jgi:hypothetical protein
MKILKLSLFALFLSVSVSPVLAADALMVTDVGTSAGMLGKGQIEGFDSSAVSVLENPAALYRVESQSMSIFSTQLMNEVDFRNIAYAKKTSMGTFAIGYMGSLIDGIPETATQNIDGEEKFVANSYFNAENMVVKAGLSRTLKDGLHVGGNLNYYSNSIGSVSGTGVNFDLGLVYEFSEFETSVVLKNVVPALKADYSNGGEETYPFQTLWGIKYGRDYLDLMAQVKTTTAIDRNLVSLGATYRPGFLSFMHLNLGMKQFMHLNDVKNHYTFGIGLTLFGLNFDYAYEKSEHLQFDNNNYFSLNFDF